MKPSKGLRQKQAADFQDKVGKHIKLWLLENKRSGHKPSDQKELAQRMDISEYQLSRYITGTTEMPARYVTRLTNTLGFPEKHFIEYYAHSKDKLVPEILTKEDMLRLVFEYQLLLQDSKKIYEGGWERVDVLTRLNKEMAASTVKLIEDYEKLRAENKELKKELNELRGKKND
jgi:transcriptional regulator with XRE-family HTH domain